ncbi:unnamed protein product [Nesidiocoris tenuis]|uniref:Aldehyde dehydrogenase domain-containing protein n=1 Tax=Nesidiocoris tenuis TaxID=355587 RepID=A0A6H5GWN7_9HEMI|nr:unnamed protein product [Nesidiocoris tenuis]
MMTYEPSVNYGSSSALHSSRCTTKATRLRIPRYRSLWIMTTRYPLKMKKILNCNTLKKPPVFSNYRTLILLVLIMASCPCESPSRYVFIHTCPASSPPPPPGDRPLTLNRYYVNVNPRTRNGIIRAIIGRTTTSIMDTVQTVADPYGVALIISSWNYPVHLTLMPLVGAIAAGNCVIIKPSEMAPATSETLNKLIPQYLHQACYKVVQVGPKETEVLLSEKFDYVFYTGSSRVGQLVYSAASKHLTPVTLEMGGKRRLRELLGDSEIAIGGEVDENERYVSPTVLTNVKETSKIMQEEIFGPILPVICVDSPNEALNFIMERLRYPPYTQLKRQLISMAIGLPLPGIPWRFIIFCIGVFIGVFVVILLQKYAEDAQSETTSCSTIDDRHLLTGPEREDVARLLGISEEEVIQERFRVSRRRMEQLLFDPFIKARGQAINVEKAKNRVIEGLDPEVLLRTRQKLNSTLVLVKGSSTEYERVKEATEKLIAHIRSPQGGSLPVVFSFEMPEGFVSMSNLREASEQFDVSITAKLKTKANLYTIFIKSVERNMENIYNAYKAVVDNRDGLPVRVEIPSTYLLSDALPYNVITAGSSGELSYCRASTSQADSSSYDQLRISALQGNFVENEVQDLEVLLTFNEADLISIGVNALGARKKFLMLIAGRLPSPMFVVPGLLIASADSRILSSDAAEEPTVASNPVSSHRRFIRQFNVNPSQRTTTTTVAPVPGYGPSTRPLPYLQVTHLVHWSTIHVHPSSNAHTSTPTSATIHDVHLTGTDLQPLGSGRDMEHTRGNTARIRSVRNWCIEQHPIRRNEDFYRRLGLEDMFYHHGVDLSFWGHEHSYERMLPLYNKTLRLGSVEHPYVDPKGPVHVTTGSAVSVLLEPINYSAQ